MVLGIESHPVFASAGGKKAKRELKKAKRELKELKGELKELEVKRDVAFKASKDTNDADDKAHYQKQIALAEKRIAMAELGVTEIFDRRSDLLQLVKAITAKMTSDVQGIATVCPPELLAQPEDHAADTATVRPHELLVPPKNHPGYDSRVTFPHTNTASLPQGAPEFDFAYIQAKCDAM